MDNFTFDHADDEAMWKDGYAQGEKDALERVTRIIRELREQRGPRPTWGSNQVTGWANYMKALDRVLVALGVEEREEHQQ